MLAEFKNRDPDQKTMRKNKSLHQDNFIYVGEIAIEHHKQLNGLCADTQSSMREPSVYHVFVTTISGQINFAHVNGASSSTTEKPKPEI